MFWQREYVRENIAMALNGTYKLDLPEHGLLGSLLLRITGTQVAGYGLGGGAWRIIDKLSKITVLLNGATICKSLTGYEAQALATYDQGIMSPSEWKNYHTNMQSEYLLINFGRYLFDTEVGLDLAKYNNVELQIENTATNAIFGDLTVSVLGFYLREAPGGSFIGHMRTEEWRTWTVASDQTMYNDLPTEHLLRRIVLQAIPPVDGGFVEKTGINNMMDDIQLSLDTGVIRVWKGGIDDLIRENYLDTGKLFLATGSVYRTAEKGVDVSLGVVMGGAWGATAVEAGGAGTIPQMEADRSSSTQKPMAYEADSPIGFVFVGAAPFLTALFRFDYDFNPLSWLDPERRKSVKLDIHSRLHADVVGGRNAIILDRFVRG